MLFPSTDILFPTNTSPRITISGTNPFFSPRTVHLEFGSSSHSTFFFLSFISSHRIQLATVHVRWRPSGEGIVAERPKKKGKRYLNCMSSKSRLHAPILLLSVIHSTQKQRRKCVTMCRRTKSNWKFLDAPKNLIKYLGAPKKMEKESGRTNKKWKKCLGACKKMLKNWFVMSKKNRAVHSCRFCFVEDDPLSTWRSQNYQGLQQRASWLKRSPSTFRPPLG